MRSCVVKFSPRSATSRCAAASNASVLAGPRTPLRRSYFAMAFTLAFALAVVFALVFGFVVDVLFGRAGVVFARADDAGIEQIYRSAPRAEDDHGDLALGARLVDVVVWPHLVHDLPESRLLVGYRRASNDREAFAAHLDGGVRFGLQ